MALLGGLYTRRPVVDGKIRVAAAKMSESSFPAIKQ